MFADCGNADFLDEFAEEASHHKFAGFGFRNATGLQIEQLFIVEAPDGRGMSGPDDVAVFDFQIRFGISDRARSKYQIAVELIRVGTRRSRSDQRVADPCGVCALAVKSAFIYHTTLALGMVVHNHGAMFDMLARIHKVDAKHIEIALIAAKILIHTDSNNIAAKRDHGMAQGRALPQVDTLVAHMLGTFVPLLDECGGHMGVLTCEDLHTFGDTCIAVMLHNNISVGAVSCDDHQMESIQVGSGTVHLDKHWLLDFTLNMQNSSAGCGIPLHRGHAIARLGNNPCIGVSRLALAIGHALSESCAVDHSDGNLGFVRRRKRFKEFFDTFHRGITPIILLAVGHFECVHIK